MGMHVVIVGNIVEGIRVIGPFDTAGEAVKWAEELVNEEWLIAPLDAQGDY